MSANSSNNKARTSASTRSVGLAKSLHDAGLIDDYRLVIAPTFAGRGRRLFDGQQELRRLELVDSQATESGALLLHYRNR